MDKNQLRLTSSEIGTLWGEYMTGTAVEIINKYMYSIVEDRKIKELFKEANSTFAKQKNQIMDFIKNEEFSVPVGFNESSDLFPCETRLFSDMFCLHFLHIITLHGLLGHTTALSSSVRKDLRFFYDSCDDDGKRMYHQTTELLLEKGHFQRDPLFYPDDSPKFVEGQQFMTRFFGEKRPLAATEMIALSLNIKKKILEKSLAIAFSQITQSKDVRQFLMGLQKASDDQIKALGNILKADNLPVPMSWESEITTSTKSPFSDKVIMYLIGFLIQASQNYHGAGLASAMRTDLVYTYEKIILKNLMVTKEWFNIMTKNNWLEQPPLAPNRNRIAKEE